MSSAAARSARRTGGRAARDGSLLLTLLFSLGVHACGRRGDGELLSPEKLDDVSAPSPDPPGNCLDLGPHRLCWAAACTTGLCVRERPLPAAIQRRALGYRCVGSGTARRCSPREKRAPRFQCRGRRCSQEQPRLPDDGEWECADLAGAVLCRGGSEPAAVAHPSADRGWWCGARWHGKNGERVCLDLDPDLPERADLRACHFEFDGAKMRRLCEHGEGPLLGDACSHPDLCPAGSECSSGICVPPKPSPNCWGDADCELGQCRFGTCTGEAP